MLVHAVCVSLEPISLDRDYHRVGFLIEKKIGFDHPKYCLYYHSPPSSHLSANPISDLAFRRARGEIWLVLIISFCSLPLLY